LASIQDCSCVPPVPCWTSGLRSSANAGAPACATVSGLTVIATRLLLEHSSPMNHLLSQYAGHATPLPVSTLERW
jgi:hypothetical protein